jgi:hypothetical protein
MNFITDGFNNGKGMKKNYPLYSVGISLKKLPYVIPSVMI